MKKILVIAVMICFYLTSFGQKYLAAARQGDAEAQYQLGNCYYYGKDGVKEDGKKAVKWYRKAAKQGHASAQCMLGHCYLYEVGVKNDDQKAAEFYQKSGNAEALWDLGDLYFEGAGVEKDIAKGLELFKSSAELGFTKAQLHLAHLYKKGEGVPKDYVKMAEWYGKAAEQGASSPSIPFPLCRCRFAHLLYCLDGCKSLHSCDSLQTVPARRAYVAASAPPHFSDIPIAASAWWATIARVFL